MQRRTFELLIGPLLVLGLYPTGRVLGQATTGTLLGTVTDSSGAVVSDAHVVVTNLDTNISQTTTTGAEGNYTVPNLAPGRYRVEVEYTGFKKAVSDENTVQVQQTTRIDVTLTPGEVSQQVTVTAQAPLVGSTTSDIGQVISSTQIRNLPLNGRLFEQLVTIVPGTAFAGWGNFAENPSAAGALAPTQPW